MVNPMMPHPASRVIRASSAHAARALSPNAATHKVASSQIVGVASSDRAAGPCDRQDGPGVPNRFGYIG